jgi:pyridoxamine 5'-phosphate oxidase
MSLQTNIAAIRKNYSMQSLSEDSVLDNPIDQFTSWLNEAINAEAAEATAMVLSTVNKLGRPSARVVLLKEVNKNGFVFFTNYDSRKGHDLEHNSFASLTFFWPALERQVRIEGKVEKVESTVSDKYFHSRPVGSQIGAWASPQSKQIKSRSELEVADQLYTKKFDGLPVIPRPDNWGGYILFPEMVEFWQGRPNRLHDRIVYDLEENNWLKKRLAP